MISSNLEASEEAILLQLLDEVDIDDINFENVESFQQLPVLIQAPWNQPEFSNLRNQLQTNRLDTFFSESSSERIHNSIKVIRGFVELIELQIETIHGNLNYYDQLDQGAVTNLLDLCRSFLGLIDDSQIYTFEFLESLTVFEGIEQIANEIKNNSLGYYEHAISAEQLKKIKKIDFTIHNTKLWDCLRHDFIEVILIIEDFGFQTNSSEI